MGKAVVNKWWSNEDNRGHKMIMFLNSCCTLGKDEAATSNPLGSFGVDK